MGNRAGMQFRIHGNTYFYFVLLLFLVPLPWLFAWLVAVAIHEFFHYAAVRLCGGSVNSLSVGIGGANMSCSNLTEGKSLCAILAGPIFGLLPSFLGSWFPRLAVCCWVLTVYNLLPLLPLDGGRALQILLKDNKCFYIIQRIALVLLAGISVYSAFVLRIGALPLAIVVGLWLKIRKRPCNDSVCKVQ